MRNSYTAANAQQVLKSLREMVEMMDSGDEPGAGSKWHVEATEALAAVAQQEAAPQAGYKAVLEAAPQPDAQQVPKICFWTKDIEGYYNTSCGEAYIFNGGTPMENNAYFCHHCGGALIVQS